mmetsp:Transcript_13190/g.34832  ORF Transcript_13190/g.34832 Transcript_13190/m.34832 type:complete len:410 (+) Transcript_13190:2-1231(+)
MAASAFCAGPWAVEPAGLRALGNEVSPTPRVEAAAGAPAPRPPRTDMRLCDLLKAELPARVHPSEIDVISAGLSGGDGGAWERLCSQDGVTVSLVAGEPRGGCVTLKAEASLPGVPVALAADQLNNFQQRTQWDEYCRDVKVHDIAAGDQGYAVAGQLMYFVLHAPPFSARDFVTQVVTMRSKSGDAYLTYTRSVEDEAFPAGRDGRVRARLDGCLVVVRRDPKDPENSSQMLMLTRQDIKLPFVPHWFINRFAPAKLTEFVQGLRTACQRKLASRSFPPAEALFRGQGKAKLPLSPGSTEWVPEEDESNDWVSEASTRTPPPTLAGEGRCRPSTLSGSVSDTVSEATEPKDDSPRTAPAEPLFVPDLDDGPAPLARRDASSGPGAWLSPWQSCAMSTACPRGPGLLSL